LAYAQDKALKLYDKCLARKFPDPTLVEVSASKITEPFSKAPPVMNIEWDYNYYQPWSDNE